MFGLSARAVQSVPWGEWPGEGGLTWSGDKVDNTSAVQLLTVYGCNRFICEGISTLPIDVFRALPGGGREEAPKPAWLEQPTPDLDRIAWLTQVLTSLLLDGNAYLFLNRSDGMLRDLVPLDPAKVRPVRENGRKHYLVNGARVDGVDILHIPGVMFPGAEVGLSPVEAARQAIGSGMSAEEFAGRFFDQGANLGGVIETQGDLPPEQAKEMARSFSRRHGGKKKAHLPGVLTGGATWKATGVTQEQAQFLQTRQFSAATIASFMFLIDPTEFGVSMDKGSSITYANLEQRNARKVQVTFLPWMVRIEAALSMLLARPRFVKFNANALLRADTKTRYESYAIGITNGFLLPDEARELEDRPPLGDPPPQETNDDPED